MSISIQQPKILIASATGKTGSVVIPQLRQAKPCELSCNRETSGVSGSIVSA